MSASAIYEGWVRHRRLDRSTLVPLPGLHALLDLDELPERPRPPPALLGATPGARALSPLRPPGRSRRPARRLRARPGRGAHRRAAGGSGPPAHQPALPRPRLQPGQLLLLLRPRTASTSRRCSRRSRTPRGASATPTSSSSDGPADPRTSRSSSTSRRSWAWTSPTTGGSRARRALHPDHHRRARRPRVFDATLAAATARALARAVRACCSATRRALAVLARIYGQALRLKLKGAPYLPHPRRPASAEPSTREPRLSPGDRRASRCAVHALLRRMRSGRLELHEAWSDGLFAFGPDDAELRGPVDVRSPRVYRRCVRGERRPRRGLRRRAVGHRRPRRPCPDRVPATSAA